MHGVSFRVEPLLSLCLEKAAQPLPLGGEALWASRVVTGAVVDVCGREHVTKLLSGSELWSSYRAQRVPRVPGAVSQRTPCLGLQPNPSPNAEALFIVPLFLSCLKVLRGLWVYV